MAERDSPCGDTNPIPRFDMLEIEHNDVSGDGDAKSHTSTESRSTYYVADTATATATATTTLLAAGEDARHSNEMMLREMEQQLSSTHLNSTDLSDLHPAAAFPETASVGGGPGTASIGGSKNDYPFSGNRSSLISSLRPDSYASLASLTRMLDGEGRRASPPMLLRYCVDLRGKMPGMHRFSFRKIPQDSEEQNIKRDVSAHFRCRDDEVFETDSVRHPRIPLLIVKGSDQELVLIVSFKGHNDQEGIGCFTCSRDISLNSALIMCKTWLWETFSIPSSSQVCLLQDGERLDQPYPFRCLREFDKLELVRVDTLMLKFVCRLSQQCEQTFHIDCYDTDYVHEVKKKFFQVFLKEQAKPAETARNSEDVWLTNGDTVVPPNKLVRAVMNPGDAQYTLGSMLSEEANTSDTFHVHFPPTDPPVLVRLNFKADSRKHLTSESVLLVSPSLTTTEILRQEVSKVIHKEPLSFKMFISGKKIEMATVLGPYLQTPSCTVVVEQRPQIELKVEHELACETPVANLPVNIHRYERVLKLKQHVCSQLDLPGYCIDLQHNNTRLDELNDLRSSRLRNGDTVKALVLPNRIRVRVRVESNHWKEVVVNDVTVTTVEQLVAYAQAAIAEKSCRERGGQTSGQDSDHGGHSGVTTFKAIHRGQFLPPSATLREVGVAMNSRVLVLQEKSFCYTSSCLGRVPIFMGRFGTHYQPPVRVMAMCDGSRVYFTNTPKLFDSPPSSRARPEGLQPCNPQLSAQFPPYSAGGVDRCHTNPPQPDAQTPHSFVCTVCKSLSLPALPLLSPIQTPQLNRSQSSDFNSCPMGLPSSQNNSMSVASAARLHSTPVGDESGGEKFADVWDGRAGNASAVTSPGDFTDSVSCPTPTRAPPPLPAKVSLADVNGALGSVSRHCQNDVNQRGGGGGGGGQQNDDSLIQKRNLSPLSPPKAFRANGTHFPFTSQVPPKSQLVPSRARHRSECQSEVEASRKAMTRYFYYQESVEQDKDGHYVAKTQFETSHNISKEMLKDGNAIPSIPFTTLPVLTTAAAAGGAALLEADNTQHSGQRSRLFDYVDESTIDHIANGLGMEGQKVMMELIPYIDVTRIEERFPKDMFRRFKECLVRWLQKKASNASMKELKRVLEENGRQDLVEEITENETKRAKAIEAKGQGYATAP
ncbi:hypothetical protein ACOMHN_004184 [Nucella lapillus]